MHTLAPVRLIGDQHEDHCEPRLRPCGSSTTAVYRRRPMGKPVGRARSTATTLKQPVGGQRRSTTRHSASGLLPSLSSRWVGAPGRGGNGDRAARGPTHPRRFRAFWSSVISLSDSSQGCDGSTPPEVLCIHIEAGFGFDVAIAAAT